MTLLARVLASIAVVGGLVAVARGPGAAAEQADNGANDAEFQDCTCDDGPGACQHYLKNVAGVTDDPCWCDKCRNGSKHDGVRAPRGWNQVCFQNASMACYLKRHSAAWGITCSECVTNDSCCQFANRANCPDCAQDSGGNPLERDYAGRDAKTTVLQRYEREKSLFKKPENLVVAYSRHFYFVTDITGMKVRMPGGTSRPVTTHEWAHLMIERAEFARREWVRNLGEPSMSKPIAMFFCEKQRDQERMSAAYFGSARSRGLTGSGDRVCEGFCVNGMGFSQQQYGDDHGLQIMMRHQLTHNLLTCWATHEIRPKSRPQWIEEGLGHWLTKTLERFRDDATYCIGEVDTQIPGAGGGGLGGGAGGRGVGGSSAPSWSGKGWDKDMAKLAAVPGKLVPIEKLLAETVTNRLTEDDHKRSWSIIDLCLREWREPFVKLLADLRRERDVREAFTENLGCTPEIFDQRWRDRVMGKRKSMAPLPSEEEPEAADAPGARDRRALLTEQDSKILAAKIRQLGTLTDKKTVKVVVDLMGRNQDLVRETALVALLKLKDDECKETLWAYGLSHDDGVVRAYVARICGRLGIESATPRLEQQLEDRNWYARAEAAITLGTFRHIKAMAAMRRMVNGDPSEKAQVAAMDALAMFGEDAQAAVVPIAKQLDSGQWQLRIAAAQALGTIGSMEAVDPLIARMEKESGRVQDEIYEALKAISRDDLGRKPDNWRKWWDREKVNAPPGKLPNRPPVTAGEKKPKADPNKRYAQAAPYFGVEIFSSRIGFVIDTSASMLTRFVPDNAAAKILSREYSNADKLTISKEEIAQALAQLDPRAHFNIVAFNTMIRSFKQNPVPASPTNIEQAVQFLRTLPGTGETNYYDALKAALDIGDEPDTNPNFRSTPDTITFLTDGEPTHGDMTDGDTLVEWYTGLNRYARVKTHTISFGTINIDMPLLGRLAQQNGGKFTLVPEIRQ